MNLLSASGRGSVHVGYGALIAAGLDDEGDGAGDWSSDESDEDEDGDGDDGQHKARRVAKIWRRTVRKTRRIVEDLWVAPRHGAVRRVVETWWSRWGLLVLLPAVSVSASVPFSSVCAGRARHIVVGPVVVVVRGWNLWRGSAG